MPVNNSSNNLSGKVTARVPCTTCFRMLGIQIFFKSPFFVSMTTAAKFVQPIPIFLAYLVPLDVDVVSIKFHQFLFGE